MVRDFAAARSNSYPEKADSEPGRLKHGSDDGNNLTTTLAAFAQCDHNTYARVLRSLDVAAFEAAV